MDKSLLSPSPNSASRAVGKGLDGIVAHPWFSLLGCLLVIALLAAGIPRLHFSNDIWVFFSPDNPDLQAYEAMENTFSKSTSVLMVVSPRDSNESLFTRESLEGMLYLTDEAWKIPYSRRVDSLTNFQYSHADGNDIIVEDLIPFDVENLSDDEIAHLRNVAINDTLLVNRLVSPDGRVGAINIPINLPGENPLAEQPEVANFVRAMAEKAREAYPHLEVRLTGIVMINQELAEAAARDFMTLIPLMFVFIFISLAVLLRSFAAPLSAFGVIVLSNVAAFGVAGWLGIQLSPPVISAINMIMTLAIADSVHILTQFRREYNFQTEKGEAMRRSLHGNFRAIFLTSLTTILGFLSLNASDSPPFRDLGNIVAIGVVFAWLFSHFLLPAIILILPVKAQEWGGSSSRSTRFLNGIAQLVVRRSWALLIGGVAVTLVLAGFILRNELNDEFVKYFDEDSEFREATDFTIDNLTGFEYIEYAMDAEESGGIAEPDYLRNLDAFAAWFREQASVRHVYAHSDMIKRLHMNLHGDDPNEYRIPDSRAVATDCLTLYEMSLPFGLDLTDRIDLDKSSTLLRVSLGNITSNDMIALDDRARAWLSERNFSPDSAGTGQSMMFARIGIRNIGSMLFGTVLALVLISLCMVVITRSWKFGLISLLPNLAPAAIGFGLWGIFSGQVGLAISVVVGMTLGIVVDDTIHFIVKYLKYRRSDGMEPEAASRQTIIHVGQAMIATTIPLVGGFGILAFSGFELNQGMGVLSAVIIGVALFFDLLVLSSLLLCADKKTGIVANS